MQLGHNRKMSGAQCLADMLKGYGVTHVFHVPAVLRTTFAEMERRTDIKRLHVHGEKAAAYMADGYARASGKPGICMAQVIGALNLAAGLRDAWLAHAPVIAMTGGREPKTKFRKVYQEIDDMPAFEPVTKFNATVDDVARFPDMVRQAFRAAVTGCPGPVHLQFRGNEGQIDAEEADMEPLVEPQFAQLPAFRPEPDEASVRAALKILQDLQRRAHVGLIRFGAERRHAGKLRLDQRLHVRFLGIDLAFIAAKLQMHRARTSAHGAAKGLTHHIRKTRDIIDRSVELGHRLEGRHVIDFLVDFAKFCFRFAAASHGDYRRMREPRIAQPCREIECADHLRHADARLA